MQKDPFCCLPPFAAFWDQLVWPFGSEVVSATSVLQMKQHQELLSATRPFSTGWITSVSLSHVKASVQGYFCVTYTAKFRLLLPSNSILPQVHVSLLTEVRAQEAR